MFSKIFALGFQITIIFLLIKGSIQQSDEGCTIEDNVSYIGEQYIGHFSSSSVSDCYSQCDLDESCEFWVLHKDTGFCDLYSGNIIKREDMNAVSGSRGCFAINETDDGTHPNDGCNIEDNISLIGDGYITHFPSNYVFDCSGQCDLDDRCEYWVLHKDNHYCDLYGGNVTLSIRREDKNAISGSRGCSGMESSTDLCNTLEATYMKQCLNTSNISDDDVDEEHCQFLLDHLAENCNLHLCQSISIAYEKECGKSDRDEGYCKILSDFANDFCVVLVYNTTSEECQDLIEAAKECETSMRNGNMSVEYCEEVLENITVFCDIMSNTNITVESTTTPCTATSSTIITTTDDTTTTTSSTQSELCQHIITTFMEQCTDSADRDEDHCNSLVEHMEENCDNWYTEYLNQNDKDE